MTTLVPGASPALHDLEEIVRKAVREELQTLVPAIVSALSVDPQEFDDLRRLIEEI